MGVDISARQMQRLERAVRNAKTLLIYSSSYGATSLVADTSGERDLICVLSRSAD
jgi:hypothetical protein